MRFVHPLGRREFLKKTGLAVAACPRGISATHSEELRASKIIPGKIPEFEPGKLHMKWADEAMIREAVDLHPFDLQGRMKIAVNAMTTCLDPNLGYLPYSSFSFQTQPPHMHHRMGDFADDTGRHTDSLWMIRSATDDRNNDEVVHKLAQNAMDLVDQGIAWNPPEKPFLYWGEEAPPKGRWAHLPEVSRVILGEMSYYRASGNPRALDTVRSMVRAHYEIAQKNDKYLWFPDFNYVQVDASILPMRVVTGFWYNYANERVEGHIDVKDPRSGTGDLGGNFPAAFMGMTLLPVLRYCEDTKDPLAAEIATKFSRLIVDLMPDFAKNIGHTHSNLATVSGVLRTGHLFGISEFSDWAEDVYKKFVEMNNIPDFGWTPESTLRPRVKGRLRCEACTTTDYIEVALQLAQFRNEKYWDDVERIAMNQLLQGQILRLDFVQRIPGKDVMPLPKMDPQWLTTERVAERGLGGFGSGTGPNDWAQICAQVREGPTALQCCFGSGPRGLYDAWYHAAQEEGDTLSVNLQFSKRLPSALITSYMPGKAVLEIQLTQPRKLLVRKPGWASATHTRLLLNGKEHQARLAGTYYDFGPLQAGSTVRVEFPDNTTRKKEKIGEVEFATVWRGNAVVEMEPAGEIYPLYQGRKRQDGATPLPFINPRPVNPL